MLFASEPFMNEWLTCKLNLLLHNIIYCNFLGNKYRLKLPFYLSCRPKMQITLFYGWIATRKEKIFALKSSSVSLVQWIVCTDRWDMFCLSLIAAIWECIDLFLTCRSISGHTKVRSSLDQVLRQRHLKLNKAIKREFESRSWRDQSPGSIFWRFKAVKENVTHCHRLSRW